MEAYEFVNDINKYDSTRYNSLSAKRVRKGIRKALILNELEREKAKGIRNHISSVLAFINSGSPTLPTIRNKEKFEGELESSSFLDKILAVPVSILFLPFVAAKMGINAIKLSRWLKQKPELVHVLKTQGLYDNLERFADAARKKHNNNENNEFMKHTLENKSFVGEYNELIEDMKDEMNERMSHF